jgi:hypothetical protein
MAATLTDQEQPKIVRELTDAASASICGAISNGLNVDAVVREGCIELQVWAKRVRRRDVFSGRRLLVEARIQLVRMVPPAFGKIQVVSLEPAFWYLADRLSETLVLFCDGGIQTGTVTPR